MKRKIVIPSGPKSLETLIREKDVILALYTYKATKLHGELRMKMLEKRNKVKEELESVLTGKVYETHENLIDSAKREAESLIRKDTIQLKTIFKLK